MPNERTEHLTLVAKDILEWAREHGALADDVAIPRRFTRVPNRTAIDLFPAVADDADAAEIGKAERTLERIKVVAVAVDAKRDRAVVLTKNQVSSTAQKLLPDSIDGVPIDYLGQASVEPNPPPIPQSSAAGSPRCFLHNGKLSCGSSLAAASIWGAGSMGALLRLPDGQLYGLTNNHVTGGCNHTVVDMHIMCPAPFDADPVDPAPVAIGRHHSFVPLASGDPGQVQVQELDVAIFKVTQDGLVTSIQGQGWYDTPTAVGVSYQPCP